ncbi:MAG TPA: sialidase family protein [Gemmatimonadaceae bacterium]|nr:sialidase family protein [Gemmatimonadaceae bacterium]
MILSMRAIRAFSCALLVLGPSAVACSRDAPPHPDIEVSAVDSPAGSGSTEPNLAVGADGVVLLSWVEPAGDSAHALRFAEWRGAGWGASRTIVRRDDIWLNWADFPTMMSWGNGRLAAHWPQRSGAGKYDYDVRISQSVDGGATWSEGLVPHPDSREGEHGFVAMGAVGDSVLAVWLDARGYDTTRAGATRAMALVGRTVTASGAMGEEQVIDARVCDCCQTDMAMTSRGAVVVYRDRTEDEIRDIVLARREASGWTAPRPVHADGWQVDFCPVNGPAVAANGDRVVAAWFTAPNDSAVVRIAFSNDDGDTFDAPIRVDDGTPVGRVDVALLDDGSAAVTWLESVGTDGAEVRVRRVEPGGRRSGSSVISGSSAARASGFPRMAAAGDALLFAWTQPGEGARVRTAIAHLK